jgi:hypothetical protein
MASTDTKYFIGILMIVVIWTTFIGVINLSSEGSISMGNVSALASPIPGQVVPAVSSITVFQAVNTSQSSYSYMDFTNSASFDVNMTTTDNYVRGQFWEQTDGIGYTCTNTILYYLLYFSTAPTYLDIDGLQIINGKYTVVYYVSNPDETLPFYTVVWNDGTSVGWYVKYDTGTIELHEYSPTTGMLVAADSFDYLAANQATEIETIYTPNTGTVDVYISGEYAGTLHGTDIPNSLVSTKLYYSGVATYNEGFTLTRVEGTFVKSATQDSPGVLDVIISFFTGVAQAVSLFAQLVGAAIGTSNQSAVPAAVWAIGMLPLIAGLIYIGLKLIRGTS